MNAFRSQSLFAAFFLVTILAVLPGAALAQKATTSDAALRDALFDCLILNSQTYKKGLILRGEVAKVFYPDKIPRQDASDPDQGFNPETGQNFVWDSKKQAWIDAKTGESVTAKKNLRDALFCCVIWKSQTYKKGLISSGEVAKVFYPDKIPRQDASDPDRGFNPETGQNFVWDSKKQAWIDAKTGECICPPCPPPVAAAPPAAAPPPPAPPPAPPKAASAGCCDFFGQSVICPEGLPAGSKAVEFVPGGTRWVTPSGTYVFIPRTSFSPCPAPPKEVGMKPPGTSFYVGIYGGLGGIGPTPRLSPSSYEPEPAITNFRVPAQMNLAATIGVGLGTWFNYPWWQLPPWLKYFGFSLNYMYYALQYGSAAGTYGSSFFPGPPVISTTGDCTFRSTGSANSLGFMFKGRYGWLEDNEVPFGRFQTWVGVGPSLNFVNQTPTVKFNNVTSLNGTPTYIPLYGYQKFSSSSATVVGLQVGVGGSYYIFRCLSADAFLQYDHFSPTFTLSGPSGLAGKVTIPVDQISFNFGLSVHF